MSLLDYSSADPLPDLSARMHLKRGLMNWEWVDVKAYSITPATVILKTDEEFANDDIAKLSLHLSLEPKALVLEEIHARVVQREKTCSCYFYEMTFVDASGDSLNKDTSTRLKRLVQIIGQKMRRLKRLKMIAAS